MPLQNRVTPDGEIIRTPARGMFMGNRGRLHDDRRELGVKRWAHQHWVTCELKYGGRRREIMAPNRYTELFFLDEATALAAGHRPCGECRQEAHRAFRELWAQANDPGGDPSIATIDRLLHRERVTRQRRKITWTCDMADLPDGAMVADPDQGKSWLLWRGRLRQWTPYGYEPRQATGAGAVTVLTPRSVVDMLREGYSPVVHGSAHVGM